MSEIDPRADAPLVEWSELGVSGLLPTGKLSGDGAADTAIGSGDQDG